MENRRRLIDADKMPSGEFWDTLSDKEKAAVLGYLLSARTVDAVEVVHGRWEKAEYCGFVRCDQCKDVYIDESWLDDGRWHYCPNCGAKMDGDSNG